MNYSIITHSILNPETGEVETKDFREVKTNKGAKGGWKMVYAAYDEAVKNIISSKKDYEILVYIRDKFTWKRVENVLSKKDISSNFNVSERKVTDIINRMVKESLLFRIERGIYRLNPFMFLPYKADAKALQKEWRELEKKNHTT